MRSVLLSAVLAVLCLPPVVAGQTTGGAAVTSAADISAFSQEPVVLREARLVLQYNDDGTGVRTETQAFTLQSEAAVRNFSVIGLAFASATQEASFVYVRVHRPNGTVIETPLDGVQEQPAPVTREAPFYSDLKQKQLPVRGVQAGDTIEWRTRTTLKRAEAPDQFWGNLMLVRTLVNLKQSVELRLPAHHQVTVWTNPASHLSPQKTTEGKETVYRWQWQSLHRTVGEEAEAEKKAREGKLLTADEELDETEGRLPDIAYTTFPDWAAVGAWYRTLEADRVQPDSAIRAKVAEITAHATTEQEKVQAVYDWVASDVRYVGVAFGIGRYQPHNAATILGNGYGDCKDKHTLLASMLTALGAQPDAVLIGAGVRFNEAVPSPESFNHLITHLTLDGKPVWLDATSEVAALQVLAPVLRGKPALVIPASTPATIQRTPTAYPFAAYNTMTVHGSLAADLSSDSDVVYTLHDDNELALRSLLRQTSPAQYPELVQNLMTFMGFGGTVSNTRVENLNDQEKPLVLRFHHRRVRDADWGENRVTALFSPSSLAVVDSKNPPDRSILLGMPREATSTVDMQLPEGWSAELPEAVHQQLAQVRIDTTYRLDGRNLHAERKVTVLGDKIPASDWKPYQAWYEAAGAGSVPYLQLVPPRNGRAGGSPGAAASASPPKTQAQRLAEAARLVASADRKLQANEVDAAEADLNAAKEYNPNQQNLAGALGVVAARRGKQAEAMELYRKEVELYPQSDFAWRNLIGMQMRDNSKGAEATAREWIASAPQSLEPRTWLMNVLSFRGDHAAALSAAKAALAELPANVRDSNAFQLLLGETQLRASDTAAGVSTLTRVIANNATALQRNDAAYELAKSHQEMPLAEATERGVLKELSAETLSWTGDEAPGAMRLASSLLTASWDTMGWILVQEKKYAEAEPYIRAAWLSRANPEVGEHLGDVEAALHKDAQSRETYCIARSIAEKAHLAPSAELKQKCEAAMQVDRSLTGARLERALNEQHIFAKAASGLPSGSSSYQVLFNNDRVLNAKPLRGDAAVEQNTLVRNVRISGLIPPGEPAALFANFLLDCQGGSCSLQLQP